MKPNVLPEALQALASLSLCLLAASPAAAGEADVYREIVAELTALEQQMPEMELSYYGSSAAGRRLPFAVVNRDQQFTAKRLARTGRPLVLITAGVHGDEAQHTGLAARLLRELAAGQHRELLDGANFLLVPALDVDGLPRPGAPGRSTTLAGLDLDRDWLKLEGEETRSLVAIVASWRPHLVIDLHGDHGADPAREGAVLRRPKGLAPGAAAWLDRVFAGPGDAAAEVQPGSSLGYFAARRLPVLRIDAAAPEPAYGALLDVLAAVATDREALQRAVAAGEALPPADVAGYVVLPGWQRFESTLRAHGIAGERLAAPQKLVAERLLLTEPRFASRPDQGLFRLSVGVRAETGTRVLPEGSLWIPTAQPLGLLVAALLEPAAPESLVSWGLASSLFTEQGGEAEAPILRAGSRPSGETRPWH